MRVKKNLKEKKNWKNYKIIIDIYNEMITLKQFLYKNDNVDMQVT